MAQDRRKRLSGQIFRLHVHGYIKKSFQQVRALNWKFVWLDQEFCALFVLCALCMQIL